MPQIEVTFEIGVDGILRVSAEDKGTGSKEAITVSNDGNRLTPEDIERMVREAEQFADEDEAVKARVEARNELESYAYSLKNQLNDEEKLGGKLDEDEKKTIEEAVEETIDWLDGHTGADVDELKEKKTELEGIVNPIVSKLYQQGGGAAPGEDDGEEYEDDDGHDEL